MGDLSQSDAPLSAWIVLGALMAVSLAASLQLDLITLGELKARSLGVAVIPLQMGIFGAAALATVAAVVLGGAIGFIGLMAPHAIRLAGVAHHRALVPLAVMLGGSLLTIADTAARTVWAPQQLPVGIVTALLGVPAMLLLLGRQR
jgi:iron complex transport system permease protein